MNSYWEDNLAALEDGLKRAHLNAGGAEKERPLGGMTGVAECIKQEEKTTPRVFRRVTSGCI